MATDSKNGCSLLRPNAATTPNYENEAKAIEGQPSCRSSVAENKGLKLCFASVLALMLSILFRAQQARWPSRFAYPQCTAPNPQGRDSSHNCDWLR